MAPLDTVFGNVGGGGGAGAASGDYVIDAFNDISRVATNNTGLSNTVSKNPVGVFMANDDMPRYGVKTLWVKDLVRLDPSLWINNKPTYQVIFNETFPSAYAYVYGNVRLRNRQQGVSIDLRGTDDGFGVTGVIRRVAFMLNQSLDTGTAKILLDGADTTRVVTFGTAATAGNGAQGINLYNAQVHGSSDEDHELHDYRITANQDKVLNIAGVEVYYAFGSSVEQPPGVTYVNRAKAETTSGTTLAAPSIVGRNGGISTYYKTPLGGYTLMTQENQSLQTIGVGTSGQNTINLTTGTGASFLAGYGIAVIGASPYVGRIVSMSTDTATVFPTLPYGVSNVLYKLWAAGATLSISSTLYQLAFSFDPGQANVQANLNGFGQSTNGDFYFSDPYKRYRAHGHNLQWTNLDGQNGVQWQGASGALSFGGHFQAAEIEFSKQPGQTGLLDCNIGINGIANNIVFAEGVSGTVKKTVFTDAGPGFNRFTVNVGLTQAGVLISKVNFYQARPPLGVSYGALAYLRSFANEVGRGTLGATVATIGAAFRAYADEFYLTGGWVRGTTSTVTGGVYYEGASTNSILKFQYYGSKFAVIGNPGTSLEILVDGLANGPTMNGMVSLANGWHTVQLTNKVGTTRVEAIEVMRTIDEISSAQTFLPRPELANVPTVFNQSDTPRGPKAGDIWSRNEFGNDAWIYLFGRWNKYSFGVSVDDPNVGVYVRTHGTSDGNTTGGASDTEQFNLSTWQTGVAGSAGRSGFGASDATYQGGINVIDGHNTAGSVAAYHIRYNLVSWATLTNNANPRAFAGHGEFNNLTWINKGDSGAGGQTSSYAFDGSSWSTKNVWSSGVSNVAQFVQGGLMRVIGNTTQHETKNTADSVSSDTAPSSTDGTGGSSSPGNGGAISRAAASTATTTSQVWTGSWASVTAPYSSYTLAVGGTGFHKQANLVYSNGGQTAVTSGVINTSERFNGVSYVQDAASVNSRGRSTGGII